MNWMLQHVTFCDRLLSLGVMFWRFIHIVEITSISFLFMAEYWSVPLSGFTTFCLPLHLLMDFWVVLPFSYGFLSPCVQFSGSVSGSGVLGHVVGLVISLRTPIRVSWVTCSIVSCYLRPLPVLPSCSLGDPDHTRTVGMWLSSFWGSVSRGGAAGCSAEPETSPRASFLLPSTSLCVSPAGTSGSHSKNAWFCGPKGRLF